MDLIYTKPNKEDVGVLHDYEFDLAFGTNENDFECQIQSSAHCCEPGSFLYIDGTEYGGIIDQIEVDTASETVTYKGRTWHGILAGRLISPEKGYDRYFVSGDANRVLEELISYLGLSDVFTANPEASDVTIGTFSFRYVDAYKGIRDMLSEYGGKLKLEFKTDTVVLSAVYYRDFSQNEEWESSQVDFKVKKNFRPMNHLICLGSGNMKDRHVIHLFADENGGILPYTKTDYPVCDDDYILGTDQQLLFGADEVAEVYDYASAPTVENYVKLAEQPDDWADNYANYFRLNEDDIYVNVEGVPIKVYVAQTEQPEDWETKYANYFAISGEKYLSVEGVPGVNYRLQTAKPSDWETNYSNYFRKAGDSYEHVGSESYIYYHNLTQKPANWESDTERYSKLADVGGFVSCEDGDEWEAGRYVYEEERTKAPNWSANTYFTGEKVTVAPSWAAETYYNIEDGLAKPSFASDVFFIKKLDNYAELVKGGVEQMKAAYECDSVSIDLGDDGDFEIGDIVGASEPISGISVWQPISKKIVNIKNRLITISYKVGD